MRVERAAYKDHTVISRTCRQAGTHWVKAKNCSSRRGVYVCFVWGGGGKKGRVGGRVEFSIDVRKAVRVAHMGWAGVGVVQES